MSKTSAPLGAFVRVLGMTIYSFMTWWNRALSLPAQRGNPNLAAAAGIPADPRAGTFVGVTARRYSSARRWRSRERTSSGTSPLTSPPYLAISFTRLDRRNEYSGLVVMNSVSTFAIR
jgi:hypothetical protein